MEAVANEPDLGRQLVRWALSNSTSVESTATKLLRLLAATQSLPTYLSHSLHTGWLTGWLTDWLTLGQCQAARRFVRCCKLSLEVTEPDRESILAKVKRSEYSSLADWLEETNRTKWMHVHVVVLKQATWKAAEKLRPKGKLSLEKKKKSSSSRFSLDVARLILQLPLLLLLVLILHFYSLFLPHLMRPSCPLFPTLPLTKR